MLAGIGGTGLAFAADCIGTTDDQGALTDDQYTIGMVDSLTGSLADFGERNQRGVELARADVQKVTEMGTSIMMVEQNATKGLSISDRGCVLDQGAVRFEDEADALLDNQEVTELYLGG